MSAVIKRAEDFIEKYGDVIEEIWDTVLDLVDKDERLPLKKKDEKKGSYSNFAWLLMDELLNKVRIMNDDSEDSGASSVTISSSEEAESLTESSDSGVHSSQLDSDAEDSIVEDSDEDQYGEDAPLDSDEQLGDADE